MVSFREDMFKYISTIVVVAAAVVYIYFKWAFSYWQRRKVEHVPPTIPFGNVSKMIRQKVASGEQFKEIYDEYKKKKLRFVGSYLFAKPILVILDLDLIKSILTTDFQHFTDHGNYVNEKDEPLTGHLFALRGQKWKHTRAKLTPTFTSGKMKMMFQTLVECSRGLKELMDDHVRLREAAEMKDAVSKFTTDVIGSCAFGLDCSSFKNSDSEFRRMGKKFFEVNIFEGLVRFMSVVFPEVISTLRLKLFSRELTNFFMGIVRETVRYRENNNVMRNDFMHLLIQLKNNVQLRENENLKILKNKDSNEKEAFTMDELAAQVLVFFAAGFETSSTTLTFCLFELVSNIEIQEKLRSEINSVLEKHNNNLTYDAIMDMPYMDKCIQETLRKYPPVPSLFRRCTENYKIPETDVLVEKGTTVFISAYGIHRDPEFYPNPEVFDPERFNKENISKRHHFAWLPFGEGPRLCIGLRFGLMQTKVALAVLLKDYKFTLNSKTKTPLVMYTKSITLSPQGGIWLNVEKVM